MARHGDKHAIRMPGQVLDEIRNREESGAYGQDARFAKKRKRTEKPVSRKEKRKQERQNKKHKLRRSGTAVPRHEESGASRQGEDADPMAALRALKLAKRANASSLGRGAAEKEPEAHRVVKEQDLESGDDFSGSESGGSAPLKVLREDELGDESFSDFDDMESDAELDGASEDPMEALRKLKEKKRASEPQKEESDGDESGDDFGDEFGDDDGFSDDFDEEEFDEELEEEEDPLAKLAALKAKKTKAQKPEKKEKVIEATFTDPVDNDMEFYAKKLGLKDGKRAKLTKLDDDDVVGGLLDGLDLDFGDASDAESGFSDQDSAEDSYASDASEPAEKENPFVAPVAKTPDSSDKAPGGKYIPPAMRRKLALEAQGVSPEVQALQKAVKGPLNKLSEANIATIVNEINALFLHHPRQVVTENLAAIIMDSIFQQARLLDTFVYLHSALIVTVYRLQGVDFGAYFIQTLIEKFDAFRAEGKTREALNAMALLSAVHAFQLVSSKLLFDIIKDLISGLDEASAELLLKMIRTSGNQIRADDPGAVKEIVLQISQKSSTTAMSPRMQFLTETIASLKNNKLKVANESSQQLMVRLKKFVGTFAPSKLSDPLQVSLGDIRGVESKGKWWLVGSAWKGNDDEKPGAPAVDTKALNDILDNAEPNWMELAKAQRMNTDIRRAIFISIMSANDYIDAVTKLDKLALKKAQERDIPRIVIHCAVVEPAWNPYYGILAAKLCDSHSYRKTFQFILWDLIKGFDGSDEDDDLFSGFDSLDDDADKLKKILNLGRLFGFLFAEGSLALHLLRTVDFVSASSDIRLFMEVLFVSFLDQVAKKSQINAVGAGLSKKTKSEQSFDDRTLIERILKAKEEPTLLKGISLFLSKRVRHSDFVTGRRQRKRVEWGVKSMMDIIDEVAKEETY